MGNRDFKNQLYEQFARIGKVLSSGHRIELLELLAQGERTVESLARELTLTLGNASSHLQVMKEARLVSTRKEGLYVYYRLADDSVFLLLKQLRLVAEKQSAEIERLVGSFLGDRGGLAPVSFEELQSKLKEGDTIVLDVRPPEEFRAGHIEGALSIPHEELARRLKEIPRGKEIIAYCRGPYCVFADEAVALLKLHKRKARRLTEGFPEWRAAGLPTAKPS